MPRGVFDAELAAKAVDWFPRYLCHTKGRWAGEPFHLFPWQRDEIIAPLFGTVKENGFRQYQMVYCEIPKKNGKSELAAGVALKLLFADNEEGAEIYSAAADRDQASIVFHVAMEMVKRNPKLANRCKVLESTKRIIHNNGNIYRVLSADAYTKHGFNAHGVIFDELHTQPNRELWDVLTEGAGDARDQPVIFAITTAGYDRNSICWEIHERARQITAGLIEDSTWLPVIYGAEPAEDWTDPKVWERCNPSLHVILDVERLGQACQRAQENPIAENTFRRLRLNQWVKQEFRYIPMNRWAELAAPPPLEDHDVGDIFYAGLDLASTTDIAALVLAARSGDYVDVYPFFWIPEESMDKHIRTDKVPYDVWKRQGYIKTTPGDVIDYTFIEEDIKALYETYDIAEIAYDRWNATQLSVNLGNEGIKMVPEGQGFATFNAPTKELLGYILKGTLRQNNPVLSWMADNMIVKTDPTDSVKPDKSKSAQRIDGMVALIMAIDRMMRNTSPKSVYATRDVRYV